MSSNAPKLVTVTVATDNHTHAGKPVAKGKKLVGVDETTARWLISKGIATDASATTNDRVEATAPTSAKKETK